MSEALSPHRAGDSWRDAVGGLWDEVGDLQFNFLVAQGLKPEHSFLDVGCGCLRGGVRFLKYLDDGNYHGIDAQQALLDAGVHTEMPRHGVSSRACRLICPRDQRMLMFVKAG